jgi:hypothetical protein
MLGDNYFYWDGYMTNPSSLRVTFSNNESISLSESGTEIGVITRLQKRTVTTTWACNSATRDMLLEKCKRATCSMSYGTGTGGTWRARVTNMNMADRSQYVARTDGLWTLTIVFSEV